MEVPKWILRTFRQWPLSDFCMDCGHFVVTTSSHCTGNFKNHIVVRRNDGCAP